MTNIKTIDKRKLYSEEIKEIIRQAILTRELKAGDRIVETQLAKQFGVSQAPVREALRNLEAVGLVEIIPYQGTYYSSRKI